MTEAVTHYGESIKAIMNEELGDGIMSAIDMYATVREATPQRIVMAAVILLVQMLLDQIVRTGLRSLA